MTVTERAILRKILGGCGWVDINGGVLTIDGAVRLTTEEFALLDEVMAEIDEGDEQAGVA